MWENVAMNCEVLLLYHSQDCQNLSLSILEPAVCDRNFLSKMWLAYICVFDLVIFKAKNLQQFLITFTNRGLAHLGIIKALTDARIPIDMVGGTSIGALMGAAWCEEVDHTRFRQRTREWSMVSQSCVNHSMSVWEGVVEPFLQFKLYPLII